jgi:hypothetical protein
MLRTKSAFRNSVTVTPAAKPAFLWGNLPL